METETNKTGRGDELRPAEVLRLLLNSSLRDASLYVLLFSNLAMIYFAITEHWSLLNVLWVYWFQSVTIGFFNFIRILQLKNFSTKDFEINDKPVRPTKGTKIETAFFFLVHYGGFHFGYFLFLNTLFGAAGNEGEMRYLIVVSAMFFLNHLFSYLYNKPWAAEGQNIGRVMFLPYVRIIPMHLTILLAMFIGFFFGTVWLLPFFLVLKTFADVLTHVAEHAKKYVFAAELGK